MHPDLHSFPTRRSSDLPAPSPSARGRARGPPPRPGRGTTRSEEHTSELQSLRHLVCRLLVEKKKMEAILMRPPLPDQNAPAAENCERQFHSRPSCQILS